MLVSRVVALAAAFAVAPSLALAQSAPHSPGAVAPGAVPPGAAAESHVVAPPAEPTPSAEQAPLGEPSAAPAVATPAAAFTEKPFTFDAAFGRLPKDVVPVAYRIAITPSLATGKIDGHESVTLTVRKPAATIVFNSLGETLRGVTLDGNPVAAVVSSDEKQLTTVTLAKPAPIGTHELAFSYTGQIVTGQSVGLFRQPYVTPSGAKGTLLSTQFESTDARRMFPCWDEPAFRATYQLTATIPAAWHATSNMPIASRTAQGALAVVAFEPSPKMPSYLVEFTAGDIASIEATRRGKGFGVWAVRGQEKYGAYALGNAQTILGDYDDYFGYTFPLPKLDSIAVPGGFDGAMENWGAITYHDSILLDTPATSIDEKQGIFAVQAHEMAHQWNGDLVTMGWWDDLWLNESFASWMAAKETDARNPTWHWWQAQDGSKERAMGADARLSSHPIQIHIADELGAETAFDSEITYAKGQAFLRMLEAYLGPDVFRAGVRSYMQKHAFSNATSADLWSALGAASGRDVGALSIPWTTRVGFPLVTATATCDASGARTLALTQKRFLLAGDDPSATPWPVPLGIRSGTNDAPKYFLLTNATGSTAAGRCDEPLSIDADAIGLYRAQYDAATLATNLHAFPSLSDGDKIALLDDQWALARTGQGSLATYLAFASAMGTDQNARAWTQIVGALGTIEVDERGTPEAPAFAAYARHLLAGIGNAVGFDPKPGETADRVGLRSDLIETLGRFDDRNVIAAARARFAAYLRNPKSLPVDRQDAVFGVVAEHADAATFTKIERLARAAKLQTERERFLYALMSVRDPALAKRALALAFSDAVPPQAQTLRVRLVGSLAAFHPHLAWTATRANTKRLYDPLGPFGPVAIAQYAPTNFWNAAPEREIMDWATANVPAGIAPMLARGRETLEFQVAQKARLNAAMDAILAGRASPATSHVGG